MTNETNEAINPSTQEETPEIINDNVLETSEISTEEVPAEKEVDEQTTIPEITAQEAEHEEEEEENEAEQVDYSRFTKPEFLATLHTLDKETDFRKVMPVLKRIKPHFDNSL